VIPVELAVIEPLGRLIARPWADAVTGLQIDSRRIAEGDLFVAVGGGVDFVEHALARGAAAALVPEDAHAALAGRISRRALKAGQMIQTRALKGADGVLAHLCAHRGLEPGQTTPDLSLTIESSPCLGLCEQILLITHQAMGHAPGQRIVVDKQVAA